MQNLETFKDYLIKNNINTVSGLNSEFNKLSDQEKIEIIQQDPEITLDLNNTTSNDKFKEIAIRKNPHIIFTMKNPSIKLQMFAVSLDPNLISGFSDPIPEEVQVAAVKSDSEVIKDINNPCLMAQQVAIKDNPFLIKFLENKSPDAIKRLAININPQAIFAMKDPSDEISAYAILKYPQLLKTQGKVLPNQNLKTNFFQNLPYDVQKIVIQNNPQIANNIQNLFPDLKKNINKTESIDNNMQKQANKRGLKDYENYLDDIISGSENIKEKEKEIKKIINNIDTFNTLSGQKQKEIKNLFKHNQDILYKIMKNDPELSTKNDLLIKVAKIIHN